MIVQGRALLVLLATVACAEGVMVPTRASLSPLTRFKDTTTSTPESHRSGEASVFPTSNDDFAITENPQSPIWTSPSTTSDTTAITEEPHPPIHSSFFTTDATTGPSILTLPRNESVSRLLFWPPSADISATLSLNTSQLNYTFEVTTALPQHWHSIDIYQPVKTEDRNSRAKVYIHTAGRYATLEYSRVVQVQVSSDQPTHWCFCPNAHLCTLISPLKDDEDSSGKRRDLLVPLLVVVFLFIITLLSLIGVTFHRRSELFHIYAKPIDCLPYASPPPLPKPNKQPACPVDRSAETKQVEAEKVAAKTDQTDDLEYSKVGGDDGDNVAHPSPPAIKTPYGSLCKQQEHESINSLYGLI